MANIWGTLDNIFSTAFGKSSLKTTMSFNNRGVAASLANSRAISDFNGFGRTAANDITLNAGDEAAKRVIKKGERVSVNNSRELSEIMNMGDVYTPFQDSAKQQAFATAIDTFKKHTGPDAVLSGDDFQKFIGREGKEGLGAFNTARGYFADETYGKTRGKVALGAAAAAAVGTRYLSGGNLTSNAQGQRDIVGVPFI